MGFQMKIKEIKERCGMISYKKGETYWRNGKVSIEEGTDKFIKARVKGKEDFYVQLETNHKGEIEATCTCPTLSSFPQDCQHVAAVLIALQHKDEQTEFLPSHSFLKQSDEMLEIFHNLPIHTSKEQQYFEKRKIVDLTFYFRVISTDERDMFVVELSANSYRIRDIRQFLNSIRNGERYVITPQFSYDPKKHCFIKEVDVVLQQLFLMMDDEKMYPRRNVNKNCLLIPPSAWERLIPWLENIPQVTLEYDGNHFIGIKKSDELLPLRFEFDGDATGFSLKIHRLNQIKIMKEYESVLFHGKILQIERTKVEGIEKLKGMLKSSGMNRIPIPKDQLPYYMEKLMPVLRQLGEVHFSKSITEKMQKTPLKAKLYLDRLKNRLLLGLEFHYGHTVINPLEKTESQVGSMIIRDREKEDEIVQLIENEGQCNRTDSGYYLHNEELEYNFLYRVLPKLEKIVQVYATTAVRNRIFRKNWKPKLRVKHRKDRMNWLEFTFDMDGIPDRDVKGILEALEEKRKYYRLKEGTLFSLETKEVEEIQRFLHEAPIQNKELENEFRVPIIQGLRLIDTVHEESHVYEDSFREFLEGIRNPDSQNIKVPSSLDTILRDYQKQGYRWMKTLASYGFCGILADDMGLGKTLQSIAYIVSELPPIRKRKLPILIVCPSSVTYNWLSEIMNFAPEVEAIVIDGKRSERMELFREKDRMDVVITSYPLLRNDIQMYEKEEFHTVFYDEAQMFKNPLTQTARAVKKIQAEHRFALTGTPMENALEELWSIFHVVFPQLFLGLKDYSELTKQQITRRIRPFMLRRVKEDVLEELPKKEVMIERHELLAEQKKLYASYLAKLRHDTFKHLDKDTFRKNRIKILAGLTRLRQICCHPKLFVDRYKGSSAKFEQLLQIIKEAKQSGRSVLIFSQFTKMLKLISTELEKSGISYFYLDGHTSSEERVELCNHFNQGKRDFFLISLKAGGTGLNLTGADTVIFYDSWWNPAVEEQAEDRAHRMGQKNTVQVIKLVAKGTIEDKMQQLQKKKRNLIEEVIDPEDSHLQIMNEEDIRHLLDL